MFIYLKIGAVAASFSMMLKVTFGMALLAMFSTLTFRLKMILKHQPVEKNKRI
jgi:hypothetical protein